MVAINNEITKYIPVSNNPGCQQSEHDGPVIPSYGQGGQSIYIKFL